MRSPISTAVRRWRQSSSWEVASTSARALRIVFGLWICAFALKHAGASWDLAWHYRYIRDDLIPPHILNLAGNALALALLYFQFRTGVAVEQNGFILLMAGFAIFLTAIPLDVLNHRLFGLDVTIWSIPHLMFFGGSTVALLGLLWMWLRQAAPGAWRTAYTLVFLTLLMDCAIYVLGQQEYGVLSLDAYLRGRPTASDDLVAMARGNLADIATGRLPLWLYPLWMTIVGSAALLGARRALPGRWTATIVAALYLCYRAVAYGLLSLGGFPHSFIPVMLIGAGLAIDLAARWRWNPVVATAALLVAYYGGAALVGQATLMPDFAPATALAAALPLFALVAAAQRWPAAQTSP